MNILYLIVVGVLAVSSLTSLALSRRSAFARVTASVFALGFAAFCGFGYLAAFELSDSPLSSWHLAYAILGVGSLIAAFLGLRGVWITTGQRSARLH